MKTTVQLQAMAAGEITQYIPPATLTAIQKQDPHPLFRAYCIGEEGEATPNVVGVGGRVLNWLRAAISAMVQKLQFGTKIFLDHAKTNAHDGRTVVGELVGKALEYVDGKMRAVAVAYIYPAFRDETADTASIEADIEVDPSGRSNVVDAVHLQSVTGIAVGDSRKHKPAFAAAGLIAQLQAFDSQGNEGRGGNKMGDLTIENVRDFIGLRRLTPSELFNEETITRDPVVRNKIKAEFETRERLQKELDKLKEEGAAEIAKLASTNKTLRTEIVTGKAKTIAAAIIVERKMPPERAKFVELHLKDFKVEGDDLADAAIKGQLDKFIDAQVEEAAKYETIFKPAAGGAAGAAGSSAGTEQGKGGDPNAGLCVDNI
jgi:hypothetical protein